MAESAKALIESVAGGSSAKAAITEGMDVYSMGYNLEDLSTSVSRAVSTARSIVVKCKAYMPSMDADKKKIMMTSHNALESAQKKLEGAEADMIKAIQAMEKYKKDSKGMY